MPLLAARTRGKMVTQAWIAIAAGAAAFMFLFAWVSK